MISLNGPKLGTFETVEAARINGERKQYKKHLVLNKKCKWHKL